MNQANVLGLAKCVSACLKAVTELLACFASAKLPRRQLIESVSPATDQLEIRAVGCQWSFPLCLRHGSFFFSLQTHGYFVCGAVEQPDYLAQFQHLFNSANPSSASRLRDFMNQADVLGHVLLQLSCSRRQVQGLQGLQGNKASVKTFDC
eukprot:754136-Pelagomonas_calceolata.AAC.1